MIAGGISGEIQLEFVELKPIRRASRADKQKMALEIESMREALHDKKVEYSEKRETAIDRRIEEQKKANLLKEESFRSRMRTTMDEDVAEVAVAWEKSKEAESAWTPLCPGCSYKSSDCAQCTLKERYDKEICRLEGLVQARHKDRSLLEGVERIMVFKVAGVDAWQKFRPFTVHSGHLGEQLKEKCFHNVKHTDDFKDNADAHYIRKHDVIDVVLNAVTFALRRQWESISYHEREENTAKIRIGT